MPTRSRARSTLRAHSGDAYVVHAERTDPISCRRNPAGTPRRARAAALVGDRARGADARNRPAARRTRLRPDPRLPAGVARRAARRARARPRLRRDAVGRPDGAAPLGPCPLRDRLARRAALRARALPAP